MPVLTRKLEHAVAPIVGPPTIPREASSATERARRLPPLLDPRIACFIGEERAELAALVARHGSPLNIVWPHTVAGNVAAMRDVLARHGVDHEVFYGAKVNKSQALVRAAVAAGVGIDVSSMVELADALRAGVDPARICATGPAKTAEFHRALVAAGALVAVDSSEELADLERVLAHGAPARVLLRLRPLSEKGSRFGLGHAAMVQALHRVAGDSRLAFEGFHVHLGSYAAEDRVAAMPELIALVDIAARLGLVTRMIDIGGGMPIRYVTPDAYATALREQRPEHYRNAKVPAAFYPYGSATTAADFIEDFLAASCRGGTVATWLRETGVRLAIEPGRSLVDQAAISVFRVTRVKPLDDGTSVIFVEGSSFSACETWFSSEFLVDPIHVTAAAHGEGCGAPLRAYIAGHSCLDDDVVTNRLLDFATPPRAGDLLIYANTAGYQMDLLENEFHRHPMPARLVACPTAEGGLVFVPDK